MNEEKDVRRQKERQTHIPERQKERQIYHVPKMKEMWGNKEDKWENIETDKDRNRGKYDEDTRE